MMKNRTNEKKLIANTWAIILPNTEHDCSIDGIQCDSFNSCKVCPFDRKGCVLSGIKIYESLITIK